MELIKESRGLSTKRSLVGRCRLEDALDERVSSLNHDEYVLSRRNVEAYVIEKHNARSIRR